MQHPIAQIDPDEVKLWLERLGSESEANRVQAASELSRMRIRARGVVRARGSLTQAAPSEFPVSLSDAVSRALAGLRDQSPAVRREVAAAVGEWSDSRASDLLRGILEGPGQDVDESVRRACVRALGIIGGPVAVEGLIAAAEHDSAEAVRRDAIDALIGLAIQEPFVPRMGPHRAIRTRGARVRPRRGLSTEAHAVLATLKHISENEGEREYLRRVAEAGVSALAELSGDL